MSEKAICILIRRCDKIGMSNHPKQECCARWSPDGGAIVYVSPGNGEDIGLMDADGSKMTPLMINAVNDFLLGWSPDGRRRHRYGNDRGNPS